jgi:molybdenum cofactor cytidylyltransferase
VTVAAIVLAAGASSRMGSPKPLLELEGQTFLGRILATLATVDGIGARIAVLGHQSARVRRGVRFGEARAVTCRGWRRGMLASLRCGVRTALRQDPGLEAVLVCHVDQPLLRAATHARLLAAFRAGRGDVLVATRGGRRGHPVLLSRAFLDRLLADRRAASLAEAIAAHAQRRVEVACRDAAIAQNVNTREALAALGARLSVHKVCRCC